MTRGRLLATVAAAALAVALVIAWRARDRAKRSDVERDAPLAAAPDRRVAIPRAGDTVTDASTPPDENAAAAEAARLAELARAAERARHGRMTTSVRGALAVVVRDCARQFAHDPATVFVRAEARTKVGEISLSQLTVDVRTGGRAAPPRFAQCVIGRGATLLVPSISDENDEPLPIALTFSTP